MKAMRTPKPLPWIKMPRTRGDLERAADSIDTIMVCRTGEAEDSDRPFSASEREFFDSLKDHLLALAERAEA
jgi:hypothetical protein